MYTNVGATQHWKEFVTLRRFSMMSWWMIIFLRSTWKVLKVFFKMLRVKYFFSKEKFQFLCKDINFVGYKICKDSITSDGKKLKGNHEIPIPTNKTNLRSLIGLANQLPSFSSKFTKVAEPLMYLKKSKNEFV
uniref:Uncharacterized protein n=1 Tax=Lepeophtheirus salmonis TaxID=72036 RepID=A0A0K2UFQ9_LEPSM